MRLGDAVGSLKADLACCRPEYSQRQAAKQPLAWLHAFQRCYADSARRLSSRSSAISSSSVTAWQDRRE